jgi:hypothetical protein
MLRRLHIHSLNKISLNKKVYLENSIQCSNCKFYTDGDKCSLYLKNNHPISAVEARENTTLCGLTAKQFKLTNTHVLLNVVLTGAFTGSIIGLVFGYIKYHL